MKILVTGGAGFVGSHLVDRLINKGHKVLVIDNLSTGKKENLNPEAEFFEADIQNPDIFEVFKEKKPEAVFHYAAQIDVRKSVENPIRDAEVNILGTLNLLENCKKFGVKKFVFASSAGVYGEAKTFPIKENHYLNPIAPYSIGKLTIEKYLGFYQTQRLDFVSLRYSNIYGPRQSSGGEGGVIAIFIDEILKGKRPTVFGDGKQTRDFLYVGDAVEATILALRAPAASIYNVGTNKEINIKTLLKSLSNIFKKEVEPIFQPLRQGEIIRSRIDYSKIRKELGWLPKHDLEEGLNETIKWFIKNEH